jgi:hypothetical protein
MAHVRGCIHPAAPPGSYCTCVDWRASGVIYVFTVLFNPVLHAWHNGTMALTVSHGPQHSLLTCVESEGPRVHPVECFALPASVLPAHGALRLLPLLPALSLLRACAHSLSSD